ncbi:hypothetical protein [Hymenobacter rubidus]|uniref:hypothetical protein n=1 Tax=Hymenobacter rubidus TaxID=1441626 RepID=UPI00191FF505|nr:hypothetical protein [Hymenobacter rubidus]
MNFLAYPLQPAAGAAGVSSRVQLPAVGRSAFSAIDLTNVKGRAFGAASVGRDPLRGGVMHQRSQHRAQCRAACMSKANF